MAAKPRLWRELEGLPAEVLEETEEFATSSTGAAKRGFSPGLAFAPASGRSLPVLLENTEEPML